MEIIQQMYILNSFEKFTYKKYMIKVQITWHFVAHKNSANMQCLAVLFWVCVSVVTSNLKTALPHLPYDIFPYANTKSRMVFENTTSEI